MTLTSPRCAIVGELPLGARTRVLASEGGGEENIDPVRDPCRGAGVVGQAAGLELGFQLGVLTRWGGECTVNASSPYTQTQLERSWSALDHASLGSHPRPVIGLSYTGFWV